MIKKLFSIILLFNLFGLSSMSMIQLWKNQQKIVSLFENNDRNNARCVLSIFLRAQEQRMYCFCACLEAIFRYYSMTISNQGLYYSQNYIFQHLVGSTGNILFNSDHTPWINEQFQINNINIQYSRIQIPQNFGMIYTDMRMFETYIISSLRQNVPVIMTYQVEGIFMGHAVIINGIQPNRDESQTIYYYQDPARTNEGQLQFFGHQIRPFFNPGRGFLMGATDNFNFTEKYVRIRLADQTFFGDLQNEIIEINQSANLSAQAGISEFDELLKFGIIKMNDFNVTVSWFDMEFPYYCEQWEPQFFIEGDKRFLHHRTLSWTKKYRGIAIGQLDVSYLISTWTEPNGDFYLNFSYKFFAKVLLTTSFIIVKVKFGTRWTLWYLKDLR